MMNIQRYLQAQSLEEAYQLNQKKSNRVIGGMLWMKMGKGMVNTAIDLCRLGLDTIEETKEKFSIGAMVTLRQMELHPGFNAYTNAAAADAVKDIVGVQFRNMATVGGSLWGRFGFSDVLTFLLSMDTQVELYRGGMVSLEQFAQMKRDRDILVRIHVRKRPATFAYQAMRNQRTDFPVIACAMSCMDGEYRAVIGARPSRGLIIRDDEKWFENGITRESAKNFADFVARRTPTGRNVRGSEAYRTHLIRVLTERNALKLGGIE